MKLKDPFKSARMVKQLTKPVAKPEPKYQGKGTMTKLKNAAEKMFNQKYST